MVGICKHCRKEFRKRASVQIFCSIPCSNRFNLNHKRIVTLPDKFSEDLAELFGILLGDGSATKYFAKIHLNARVEQEYSIFVKDLLFKLFPGASVTAITRTERGVIEIQISSRDVCDYLNQIGFDPRLRIIPAWIMQNSIYIQAAMRGLFDTEGSVGVKYFKGKGGNYVYKQLTVANKNKNILLFLERALTANGFRPTKNSNKNIYISNKLDIARYLKDIGSHNPKMLLKLE